MIGWLRERFSAGRIPAVAARWVVVDCETSGLDPERDRLLSLAALGVRDGRIALDDTFSVLVRQAHPTGHDNILVHGIGRERQAGGASAEAVVGAFRDFAGHSPRVAWRAGFDRVVISRALRSARLRGSGPWLDLAQLMPVLFPKRGGIDTALEGWLASFGIAHPARHDALADAYASAQLLQIALKEAARQGFHTVGAVLRAAR